MRILVTGSREWDDYLVIENALHEAVFQSSPEGRWPVTLVHGAARGADSIAAQVASDMAQIGFWVTLDPHPADWDKHGKAAGFIRNQEMVDAGADVCLAFLQPGAANRGTKDCIARAEKAGIPVWKYGEGNDGEPSRSGPDSPPAGESRLPGPSGPVVSPDASADRTGLPEWPVIGWDARYELVGGFDAWMEADGTWHMRELVFRPAESERVAAF